MCIHYLVHQRDNSSVQSDGQLPLLLHIPISVAISVREVTYGKFQVKSVNSFQPDNSAKQISLYGKTNILRET